MSTTGAASLVLLLLVKGTLQGQPQLQLQRPRRLQSAHVDAWPSKAAAKKLLADNSTSGPPRGKLAYTVLTDFKNKTRLDNVLTDINTNLRTWTPGDVIIFHTGELDSPQVQQDLKKVVSDVIIMRVPDHHWQLPNGLNASQFKQWHGGHPIGYRHMCRWYSNGIFHTLQPLGYNWVWRLDEDSRVPEPVQWDVIAHMEANGMLYGYRKWATDTTKVTWSLPEITAWYIVAHKIDNPWIFQHCNPKNMSGLNSYGGWDTKIIFTNLFIANVDFWLTPPIQKYLTMLEAARGYYLYRWGDAPVHTMLIGTFLAEWQILKVAITYCHGHIYCWKPNQA